MGMLELRVDLTNRGRSESFTNRYRGIDQLITKGVDDLAARILESYDPSLESSIASNRIAYQPAVSLLTPNLDALRHYWKALWPGTPRHGLAEHEFVPLSRSIMALPWRTCCWAKCGFPEPVNAARTEISTAQEQAASLTPADKLRINACWRGSPDGLSMKEFSWRS